MVETRIFRTFEIKKKNREHARLLDRITNIYDMNLGIIILVIAWLSVAMFGIVYTWYMVKNPPENIHFKMDRFRRMQLMKKYKHLLKK